MITVIVMGVDAEGEVVVAFRAEMKAKEGTDGCVGGLLDEGCKIRVIMLKVVVEVIGVLQSGLARRCGRVLAVVDGANELLGRRGGAVKDGWSEGLAEICRIGEYGGGGWREGDGAADGPAIVDLRKTEFESSCCCGGGAIDEDGF
eukprot:scaffold20231_cov23-Cyclotella_meneghiniana.AAC.3